MAKWISKWYSFSTYIWDAICQILTPMVPSLRSVEERENYHEDLPRSFHETIVSISTDRAVHCSIRPYRVIREYFVRNMHANERSRISRQRSLDSLLLCGIECILYCILSGVTKVKAFVAPPFFRRIERDVLIEYTFYQTPQEHSERRKIFVYKIYLIINDVIIYGYWITFIATSHNSIRYEKYM